jgi:hypothetical protein
MSLNVKNNFLFFFIPAFLRNQPILYILLNGKWKKHKIEIEELKMKPVQKVKEIDELKLNQTILDQSMLIKKLEDEVEKLKTDLKV